MLCVKPFGGDTYCAGPGAAGAQAGRAPGILCTQKMSKYGLQCRQNNASMLFIR